MLYTYITFTANLQRIAIGNWNGISGLCLADAEFRGERRFARNQVQISCRAPRVSPLSLILDGISFPKSSPRRPHLSSSPHSSLPPPPFRLPRLPILHGWNFKAGLKWKRRQAGFGKRQLDFKCPLLPSSSCLRIAFDPL